MRLLLVIAVVVAGYLLYKLYFQQLMSQGKAGKIKIAMIVVGLLFLVAALTGRANAIFAIIGAAMTQVMRLAPLLIRFAPNLAQHLGGSFVPNNGNAPNTSKVKTNSLVMTLDHASGKMDGEIITGALAGKQLSDLTPNELKRFYHDCAESDPEAIRLLEAYIARERSDWDEAPGPSGDADSRQAQLSDAITVREAYDILGLEQGATRAEIVQSHRSLMKQFHPDKGGSNYLASKVNEAKKVLLAHVLEE